MNPGQSMAQYATRHPWWITLAMLLSTALLAGLAMMPTLWPERFSALQPLKVDTDPENMLPEDEPVRVFHNQMKREMNLHDMVVVGIVNESDPDGVFNPESLRRIYELTQFAKTLRWPDPNDPEREIGVIEIDLIAPSTVDNIEQGSQPGFVNFEWLMRSPPETREAARAIRDRAQRIPFLDGTLVSEDGKAICLYLPLTSKDLSNRVYEALKEKIAAFDGGDAFHITGLPVAEDVFGVEMFKQMAISAPIAMVVIFLLMLLFFRRLILILSPMIVAMICVLSTMGLLVITGNTVHIMSSMIPIFIMPIAVLDSVHILSEFFDRYQATRDRRKTIVEVTETLFWPMFFTSLSTSVGFASLALTPIPPVQVFGLFVAFGVLLAWIWTITFIPAFIMFLPEKTLENFGALHQPGEEKGASMLTRWLARTGQWTTAYAKAILFVVALISVGAIYGISRIQINDNPIKWFTSSHPIRVADRVLNEHFGGTYMAYLVLQSAEQDQSLEDYLSEFQERLDRFRDQAPALEHEATVLDLMQSESQRLAAEVESAEALLKQLEAYADEQMFSRPEAEYDAWDQAMSFVSAETSRGQTFKRPEVLHFVESVQKELRQTGVVGKSSSLADIVKTVRRELVSGKPEDFKIPESPEGVAQTLLQYQNSHRPQDLWHFVTPDYKKSVLWVQLKSGDNREMSRVVSQMNEFMASTDLPTGVAPNAHWFGLTYINVIWQDKMVSGMLQAFLGSFIVVFLMMTLLYRSAFWGLLSMVPLTVTIALIYGIIGLIGKDYDMPVAVLSSLSLGLAIDYAIHFLSRSRALYQDRGSWALTAGPVFAEPARAIARNAIVIGMGFLPLLAAPLIPYKTVGIFIAAILLTAGLASLIILPALIQVLEPCLFPKTSKWCFRCKCTTCGVGAVGILGLLAFTLYRFFEAGWTMLTTISVVLIVVIALICYRASRGTNEPVETTVNEKEDQRI